MTRKEFEEMSFEDLMEWSVENLDDVTTEDALEDFAKEKIDNGVYYMAIHILNALKDAPYDAYYFIYDYSMGTLKTPTAITCKEDIEDLIDFEN